MPDKIDTPQLHYPFELRPDGQFREIEQDDLDEIGMAVEIVLRYPIRYRQDLPAFGIPDLSFRESHEEIGALLLNHVSQWEPRARLFVEERPVEWDRLVRLFVLTVEAESDE